MKRKIIIITLLLLLSCPGLLFADTIDKPILKKPVQITVSEDSSFKFEIETSYKRSGLRIYLGVLEPGKKYPVPRYRFLLVDKDPAKRTTHIFRYNLERFEAYNKDVLNFRKNGFGIIQYQIVIPVYGGEEVFYGRFGFIKKNKKYFRAPIIIEGPFIDQVTTNSAVISYTLNEFGTNKSTLIINDKTYKSEGIKNEIIIKDLSTAKSYNYSIQIDGYPGDFSGIFKTDSGKPNFKFAVMCDSRGGYGYSESTTGTSFNVVRNLMIRAADKDIDFIVFPGDLVDGYLDNVSAIREQYAAWKKAVEPVAWKIPIYEGIGNHEMVIDIVEKKNKKYDFNKKPPYSSEDIFAREFVNPGNGPDVKKGMPPYKESVYSFVYGDCTFIMLNNVYNPGAFEKDNFYLHGYIAEDQMNWLEIELKRAKLTTKHTFVFLHEPAFPNGGHLHDSMFYWGKNEKFNTMRKNFVKLLSDYEVDILFAGHEHNYNRMLIDDKVQDDIKEPFWQVISGGAGAPYYNQDLRAPWKDNVKAFSTQIHYVVIEVKGKTVKLTCYSDQDQVLDEFVF